MKRYYSKPEIESVVINTAWALCLDGSGGTGKSDPNPKPPMPGRRGTPTF